MNTIDFRSDTVTHPTPKMIQAMAAAKLGDDVYGEDPTVNELQKKSAKLLGKEAALFVPSGTMGNLASVLAHCGRGDEVIMGTKGHTFLYEAGGIAALGGVHPSIIPNEIDGTLNLQAIRDAVRVEGRGNPTEGDGDWLRPHHIVGMSECQFYEFVAVDKPVTEEEAPYPWSVSSRAEVTPWRWRNVYNWGDFRGSVEKMMAFYDAHVYLANWGTFRFALGFPEEMLSAQDVQAYLTDEWLADCEPSP